MLSGADQIGLERGMNTYRSIADWVPETGRAVDVVALGRSGASLCGRTRVGAIKVLIRLGPTPVRPVEGELFTLEVTARTRETGFWVLEGAIRTPRLNVDALRLEPLALLPRTPTDRGDGGSSPGDRTPYELETIVPRVPGFRADGQRAIDEIAAFWSSGDAELAEMLAGELLARDLRCLEAHALLGALFLDGPVEERWTERALRHYRVGAAIGGLSLAEGFDGTLPWRWRGNRAFLRCLYGYARCLERVGDAGSAREQFERLLELAPEGPMGVREALDGSRSPEM